MYNDLWMHSALVSTCAAYLGQNVFHRYEQVLGTIGLLHDVGKNYLPLFKKKDRQQVRYLPALKRMRHMGSTMRF